MRCGRDSIPDEISIVDASSPEARESISTDKEYRVSLPVELAMFLISP